MSDSQNPAAVTRATTVAEADRKSVIGPIQIDLNCTLQDIVAAVERAPRVQTISVIDASGRLQGIIPFSQITEEIFMRVVPEEFMPGLHGIDSATMYAAKSRLLRGTTAGEMMSPPIFVYPEETVAAAFHKIHSAGLLGLPIVDRQMMVIGYLDIIELIMVWVRASQARGGGE